MARWPASSFSILVSVMGLNLQVRGGGQGVSVG
jgi:hypothetical protein